MNRTEQYKELQWQLQDNLPNWEVYYKLQLLLQKGTNIQQKHIILEKVLYHKKKLSRLKQPRQYIQKLKGKVRNMKTCLHSSIQKSGPLLK